MIAKITSYKLYFKLIFFSLIFFFGIKTLLPAAVLTEEEIRYIPDATMPAVCNMELSSAATTETAVITTESTILTRVVN